MNIDIDEFVKHYVVTLIWQAPEEDDGSTLDQYTIKDLDEDSLKLICRGCKRFIQWAEPFIEDLPVSQTAHDFCLTRNRHGAGFWDRGLGERGKILTEICDGMGEMNIYASDGKLFVDNNG